MTNETNELRPEAKRSDRVAFVVFAVLAANAFTAFAIQAWMTFGFGSEVWKLPDELAVALIVALDLFAVMYMILTYLLRGTGWPRFAATLIFLFAIGAQVFAAELFGDHRGWSTEVRWFAGLPAVFLALSQEGVILWRTHRNDPTPERTRVEPRPPPPRRPAAEVPGKAASKPAAPAAPTARKEQVETGKTQVKTAAKPRKDDGGKTERRDRLVGEILAGKTTTHAVAASEGVSPRAVQLWVKAAQVPLDPPPAPPPVVITKPLTSTDVRPINGAAHESGVTR